MSLLPYQPALKATARRLRNCMTDAERRLWFRLRRGQIAGVCFYRQKPLGPFIVDFYVPAASVVIEIDGGQHFTLQHHAADRRRDIYLRQLGLRVIRFDNRQVLLETDAVVETIYAAVCKHGQIPPVLPFTKGGTF
jgi:very-short-patch-repair endonuclease